MSAISRPPNRLTEFKSGGKIVRPRRVTTRPTPYDRPTPRLSPISTPHSPNWLSRFIFSPTRLIATGAGKVFSSVFGSESSASSSSSSDVDEEDANSGSSSGIANLIWLFMFNQISLEILILKILACDFL